MSTASDLRRIAHELLATADRLEAAPPAAPPPPPAAKPLVIPGGRTKGTPLREATTANLRYWEGRVAGDLASGAGKPEYAERDRAMLAGLRAELSARG